MNGNSSSKFRIEDIPLRTLLTHPSVFDMYEEKGKLLSTQAKLNADLYGLSRENAALTCELTEMRQRLQALEASVLPSQTQTPP